MARAICLYGQREIMEQLSAMLQKHGIEMDPDYYDREQACEKLREDPGIDAVLIAEYCIMGMERGKYECVEAIRAADKTVRIVVLMNGNKTDHEYENWAYRNAVRDICYPNGNKQYDITGVAACLKAGRVKNTAGDSGDTAPESGAEPLKTPKKSIFKPRKDNVIPIREIMPELEVFSAEELEEEERVEELLIREAVRKIREEEEAEKQSAPPFADTVPEVGRVPPPVTHPILPRSNPEPPHRDPEPIPEAPLTAPEPEVRTIYVDRPVHVGTYVIAVFNFCRGAGATTTACRVSDALYKSGRRTALLSFDGKDDIGAFPRKYDYYFADDKTAAASHVIGCGDYDAVVIDFGLLINIASSGDIAESEMTGKRAELAEFLRCHLKIGMCFTAPWHRDKPRFFLDNAGFGHLAGRGGFVLLYDGEPKGIAGDYGQMAIMDRNSVAIPELFSSYLPGNGKRKAIRKYNAGGSA